MTLRRWERTLRGQDRVLENEHIVTFLTLRLFHFAVSCPIVFSAPFRPCSCFMFPPIKAPSKSNGTLKLIWTYSISVLSLKKYLKKKSSHINTQNSPSLEILKAFCQIEVFKEVFRSLFKPLLFTFFALSSSHTHGFRAQSFVSPLTPPSEA